MRNVSIGGTPGYIPRNRGQECLRLTCHSASESGRAYRTAHSAPSGFASGKQASLTHSA